MQGLGQTETISSPPRTFDFSQICRLCAQRNVRIDSPSPTGGPSLVGTGTYFKAWDALMRWIQHQQDSSKAVNIQHFGTVGYIIGNEQKQMYLKLSEKFLFSQGLSLDQARTAQIEQIGKTVLAPTVRANYSEIAKLMGAHSEERAHIATCLTTIFEVVGNLLSNSTDSMIHIDLGLLGIVSAHQQAVFVVPYQKLKPEIHTHHKSKQTVMDLLNIERSGLLSARRSIPSPHGQTLPRVESHPQFMRGSPSTASLKPMQASKSQTRLKPIMSPGKPAGRATAMATRQAKKAMKYTSALFKSSVRDMLQNSELFAKKESPTRRGAQLEEKSQVGNQFLGAGEDTLTKDQDFSKIKPSLLLSRSFRKPQNSLLRYPPALDFFSRTLAAPVTSQKYYFSLSHRIASNYTPSLRGVYFDTRLRAILYKPLHAHSKASLSIITNETVPPATDEEEYMNIIGCARVDPAKLKAKANSFNRYWQYIRHELPDGVLAPFKEEWSERILFRMVLKINQEVMSNDFIQEMVDDMLHEVNIEYKLAMKKAIMDYILLDVFERGRLGIQPVILPPPEWGTAAFVSVAQEAALEESKMQAADVRTLANPWHQSVEEARESILETLCIYTPSMLRFKTLWEKYSTLELLILPEENAPPILLSDFIKNQEIQMTHVKNVLINNWVSECSTHLREEIETFVPQQVAIFSEAVASLMSIQLRDLTTKAVQKYVKFMRRFKKPAYRDPTSILSTIRDIHIPEQNAFILLNLKRDSEIKFSERLDIVQRDLVSIITKVIKQSHGIIRPDNQATSGEKLHLWEVPLDSQFVVEAVSEIKSILKGNLDAVEQVLDLYKPYHFLLTDKSKVERFVNTEKRKSQEQYEDYIASFDSTIDNIRQLLPHEVRMSGFVVSCVDVNEALIRECEDVYKETLMRGIAENIITADAERIAQEFNSIKAKISVKIETAQQCIEVEQEIENARSEYIPQLLQDYKVVREWLSLLHSVEHIFINNPLNKMTRTVIEVYTLVRDIESQLEFEENKLKDERNRQESDLVNKRNNLIIDMDSIHAQVNSFKKVDVPKVDGVDNIQILADLQEHLEGLIRDQQEIEERERILGFIISQFPKLEIIGNNLRPYQRLWILCRDSKDKVKEWKKACIFKLNSDTVIKERKSMQREAAELKIIFSKGYPIQVSVLDNQIIKTLNEFKKYEPILQCLLTEGFKPRHWEELAYLTKIPLKPPKDPEEREHLTLNHYYNLQLYEKPKELEEIAQKVAKEYQNERIIDKIKQEWDPMVFQTRHWRDGTTLILVGQCVEDMQTLLDEHILKIQTMKGSPYAKPLLELITDWEEWILKSQDILDIWTKVQSNWLYLKPVFTSEDIMKQMPAEGAKFAEVDRAWHNLMRNVEKNNKSLTVLSIPNILRELMLCQEKLDDVKKGLNEYLATKQAAFPRFYFLSDEELLEILSETKEPLRVQKHIKKCFEGINKLNFNKDKIIVGMQSKEEENVRFLNRIDPAEAKDKVEYWLNELDSAMVIAVKDVIQKAAFDYKKKPRQSWVIDWPGQAVLAENMREWTEQTENRLRESGNQGLFEYETVLNKQIEVIVELVRGNLSNLSRCTLQALIVLDVHNKDVIATMARSGVSEASEFQWQAQLRYYWNENDLWVKIINATLEYNYEYIGNSTRLVLTPLTDRCYRTLCGAVHLNYGGAPEGPAGTGKTETVKDLAKALARYCMVFNCSEGLDHLSMAKFFKGLASCGAWSCFDEFNRIDLEVLSVVAQQLMSLQQGVARRQTELVFEGTLIRLRFTCSCFITMNPGYQGRQELPDNLKALFRTVAMMVADYAMIAEITLYSFGFLKARELAIKIYNTYKLCSEQLSSQPHYDYGMRAVKSVLTAAGNLKRKYPQEDESILTLRAINDVNMAKFLDHDLPLFKGITSDLFPGIQLPAPDYQHLQAAISHQMEIMNLQPQPYFLDKVVQLYEMIVVRHGLMVVGEPFAGKTSAITLLANALSELGERGGLMGERNVLLKTVYPKSITMGQLYGRFDEISHDWNDGVLAVCFRQFADPEVETNERKWLIFDGPVDALWIENMNTVLDDTRKLCLSSGETIRMTEDMNLLFEPMDLREASPATVSRCGMVYMEPHKVGWAHLYTSWKNTLPAYPYTDQILKNIDGLKDQLVAPLLAFLRKELHQEIPTMDQNLLITTLKLFRIMLGQVDGSNNPEKSEEVTRRYEDDDEDPEQAEVERLKRHSVLSQKLQVEKSSAMVMVNGCFLFALTWGICGSVTTRDRKKFDLFFKRLQRGDVPQDYMHLVTQKGGKKTRVTGGCPDRGTMYDYLFLPDELRWVHWNSFLQKSPSIPHKSLVSQIIIPTIDTVRYNKLLSFFLEAREPALFVGPTGTGKSLYVKQRLAELGSQLTIEVGFSAQTSANQTQDIIDNKLERRKKDYYGPHFGQSCIIFVDDLNMPKKEIYGAQPPLQLLRQFLDKGGWYDYHDKKHPFRHIIDTTLVGAMGSPSAGRQMISPRVQRHFLVISVATFDDHTMTRIFNQILKWYLVEKQKFVGEVQRLSDKLVLGTLEVYKNVAADLKPTPLRSHYTFNLRDFAKVIFGICLAHKADVRDKDVATRLWIHEVTRVFGDRLIDDHDQLWLLATLRDTTRKVFGVQFDSILKHLDTNGDGKVSTLDQFRGLIFSDVMGAIGMPNKPYVEITDYSELQQSVEVILSQYNEVSEKPMDLVLFHFAIQHLLRIGRILKQPGGNALLVGVGGSGRQSLTRLAAKISDFNICQIELNKAYGFVEWRDDLKSYLKLAGGTGVGTVFLLPDTQIKDESFLEDINNVLNSGEVPNLYPPDEKSDVCELVRQALRHEKRDVIDTPGEIFKHFIQRCQKYLHIVLCFSPIGDSLRNRIRSFPSLVNCCTIDWYSEWPDDALESVAEKYLAGGAQDSPMRNEPVLECVEMCKFFHKETQRAADDYAREEKRNYYVTATSYLQLIQTFNVLLKEKKDEVRTQRDRYTNGYDCLIKTEEIVTQMQFDLEELKPKLIKSQQDTEEQMSKVALESMQADQKKEVVLAEEEIANKAAEEAKQLAAECQREVDLALPQLQKAKEALGCIDKQKIAALRVQLSPPDDSKMVLAAVCVLQGVAPDRKLDMNTGKATYDFWRPSVQMMTKGDFLKSLIQFDKDNIDPKRIEGLKKYLNDKHFKPSYLNGVSEVAASLAEWVIAVDKYYHVTLEVRPKQERMKSAKAKQREAEERLRQKKSDLKVVLDRVDNLNRMLKETQDYQERLEQDIENCKVKLERAKKLINGLGGEKSRWLQKSKELKELYSVLVGDVLISAGIIAYLGFFGTKKRAEIVETWIAKAAELKIPASKGQFELQRVLGDPVQIRSWAIAGLPSDEFSIDNGIIIHKSQRWTLNIDPQGQANKWLKNLEKQSHLQLIRFSDKHFIKLLETAIQYSHPVLLENVGEQLDPSIDALLNKRILKKGRSLTIKLGDTLIDYSPDFRFYLTTKLRNPHYMPEISTAVTLINFGITYEGLRDQLLSTVVAKERPELETEKERLITESAQNKEKLASNEDNILNKITTTGDKILDDSDAIQFLSNAKKLADDINQKQKEAEETERGIDEARLAYKPVAMEAAALFFCISDLAAIDPMYQYSLNFFLSLFVLSINNSDADEEVAIRLNNLKTHFLSALYNNICRSLFEKDKLIFSFLLCTKLMWLDGAVNEEELRFLLTGGISVGEDIPPNPASGWLSQTSWAEICRLSQLPAFETLANAFQLNLKKFQDIYDSATPHEMHLPAPYHSQLTPFQRLLVIRCLRPDKLVPAMQNFVMHKMGKQFILPPEFELSSIYKDSSPTTPLIFVLSPGADPLNMLMKFSETRRRELTPVSLGKGQGTFARNAISQAIEKGNWVVLQNCHLAVSWLPELEAICESISPNPQHTNRQFRLWLTSYPSTHFPVSILQSGIKMTNEAPKGLRNNLLRSLASDPINDPKFFQGCQRKKEFHKLLLGLCFFHAVVQERRAFGPLGWNIPYEFSDNDLKISALQLQMFINEALDGPIPFETLSYLTGECNYGGRVTEDNDRRLIETLLADFYTNKAFQPGYCFSKAQEYKLPELGSRDHYLSFVRNLPNSVNPEVYGLHENADITREINETNLFCNAILLTMVGSTGSSKKKKKGKGAETTGDQEIVSMCERILEDVPPPFDIVKARERYKVNYNESMNTVLTQEMERYNELIETIRGSLSSLMNAIEGLILMTADLEATSRSMLDGKIPPLWLAKSYPSLKPLGGYVKDLKQRLAFFTEWYEKGTPGLFWINKFYFTHGFLTGALQNYARMTSIPIDQLDFDFEVIEEKDPLAPATGVHVIGLYFQGARFDIIAKTLMDSLPKVLYEMCPILWLKPCLKTDISTDPCYLCPAYKTSKRQGVLKTNGQSSNFIRMIRIPSDKPESYWIKRGVALLTQLNN